MYKSVSYIYICLYTYLFDIFNCPFCYTLIFSVNHCDFEKKNILGHNVIHTFV